MLRPGDWVDTFHIEAVVIGPATKEEMVMPDGSQEAWEGRYRIGHDMNRPDRYNVYHEKWLKPRNGFDKYNYGYKGEK